MKHEIKDLLKQYQQFIETYMEENCFCYDSEPQKILFDAMRYSLLAGGKRLRPVFVFDLVCIFQCRMHVTIAFCIWNSLNCHCCCFSKGN